MAKNVLSLKSQEAMDFFLKSEQYHSFELPEYYVFDKVLQFIKDKVGENIYEDCLQGGIVPDMLCDVNFDILLNKDGRYAVRPIVLSNPYLYYFLVRELCDKKGWNVIQELFDKFKVPHLASCALPVVPEKVESFHKSTTIMNWWNSMEQRSIELSLEYRYMFVTDITNCYGSVNPQAFDWAFRLKNTKYERECDNNISENIQKYLRAMQQGRNIGIPQGSAIFDFVGEIILGYLDLLLHEAIQKSKITASYEIIRYRDDYRIFCNDKDQLEKISYILQQVLESLNFRMNSQKTKISESVVLDSIKSDKLFYIYNTPIFNKKGVDFDSFEKHLLYILMFARQYPNSGQVKIMLSDIDRRMEDYLQQQETDTISIGAEDISIIKKSYFRRLPGGSVRAMVAVATQIAMENVSVTHYALRVISRMINTLPDNEEKSSIVNQVYHKLRNTPNSTYDQLWLQNMTYTNDKANGENNRYDARLCQIVMGSDMLPLWNNDWIKPKFKKDFPQYSIVNSETLQKVTPIITFRERRSYEEVEY